jgi:pimeloyl-ACP methyl ester carboxylesterase
LQQELANLFTNNRRVVATGCGYYIHHDNPKLVIDTIQELIRGT